MRFKLLVIGAIISAGILAFFIVQRDSVSVASVQENSVVLNTSTYPYDSFSNSLELKIQFFGDIMIDRNVSRRMGKTGLAYVFEKVNRRNLLGGADLTIANLEGPFAPYRVSTTKSIAFRFDPKYAPQLKRYGFSAFSLANNHSYDMMSRNVAFTKATLEKNGLHWFGDELSEGEKYTWIVTTTRGEVAFIGVHNTYHEPNLKKLERVLTAASQSSTYVIVNVHWGAEYRATSTPKQQQFARWLVDHGATAVIGHHPHVVEEAEVYKGSPIFYSLGNFVFDQYFSTPTQQGFSVGLILGEGRVKAAHVFPYESVQSKVIPLSEGEKREKILNTLNERSRWDGKQFENGILTL